MSGQGITTSARTHEHVMDALEMVCLREKTEFDITFYGVPPKEESKEIMLAPLFSQAVVEITPIDPNMPIEKIVSAYEKALRRILIASMN